MRCSDKLIDRDVGTAYAAAARVTSHHVHAPSVQLTEALAEYWHARIRSELVLPLAPRRVGCELLRQGFGVFPVGASDLRWVAVGRVNVDGPATAEPHAPHQPASQDAEDVAEREVVVDSAGRVDGRAAARALHAYEGATVLGWGVVHRLIVGTGNQSRVPPHLSTAAIDQGSWPCRIQLSLEIN